MHVYVYIYTCAEMCCMLYIYIYTRIDAHLCEYAAYEQLRQVRFLPRTDGHRQDQTDKQTSKMPAS